MLSLLFPALLTNCGHARCLSHVGTEGTETLTIRQGLLGSGERALKNKLAHGPVRCDGGDLQRPLRRRSPM